MKCEYCGSEFEGNYCPMCGTRALKETKNVETIENPPVNTPIDPASTELSRGNKQRKWLIFMIISAAVIIAISTLVVVLGIPALKYYLACDKLGNGFYEEAIEIFEELDGYKQSEDKINAAKYEYVLENMNNDDQTTYIYLKDLHKQDYKDSKNIFNSLYEWKISVIAINSSKNDDTTYETSISKNSAIYFHMKLTGGEPGESIRITVYSEYPDGGCDEYIFEEAWGDGDILWYGWPDGLYADSGYDLSGILRCYFCNENGEVLGAGSIKITD